MAYIYTYSSDNAVFIWPSLACSFGDGFWIELAWLSWAIGLQIGREEYEP